MKKRLEFVMNNDEFRTVANIIGTEKQNTLRMANKLEKEDVSKDMMIDFLRNEADNLQRAENIMRL